MENKKNSTAKRTILIIGCIAVIAIAVISWYRTKNQVNYKAEAAIPSHYNTFIVPYSETLGNKRHDHSTVMNTVEQYDASEYKTVYRCTCGKLFDSEDGYDGEGGWYQHARKTGCEGYSKERMAITNIRTRKRAVGM